MDEVDDRDERAPTPRVAQEDPPSPPMRSPVTFAGLLPALGAMALMCKELKLVVKAMLPPQPQLPCDEPGGARMRHGRWPTASLIGREGEAVRAMTMMAGTDARGFQHPPYGGEGCGPSAGDDVRLFRRPSNLEQGDSMPKTSEDAEDTEVAGSLGPAGDDVHCFRRPSNLGC